MVVITAGEIELKEFTRSDSRFLYVIRNHSTVRAALANPATIAYQSHLNWVNAHFGERPDMMIFLARVVGERPMGMMILRDFREDTVEIGAMFREPDERGTLAATASTLTLYYAMEHLHVRGFYSYADARNSRALKLNRAMGASDVPSDKPGELMFRMDREAGLANPHYRRVLSRLKDLKVTGKPEWPEAAQRINQQVPAE